MKIFILICSLINFLNVFANETATGQPTTETGQQTTEHGQPTTERGQPTTEHGQPTTEHGQPTAEAQHEGLNAEAQKTPSIEAREGELLDFNSIKDILRKDALEKDAQKKQTEMAKKEQSRVDSLIDRHNIPDNKQIWGFLSELWLVRKAQILKWDFEHADLGIDVYFKDVLKVLGLYQRNFKILLMNNPTLPHAILPGREGENIILLSLPFMQTMDLTKQEISMLILENYFRAESGILDKKLATPEFNKIIGKNFYKGDFPKAEIEKALGRYDDLFFNQGFQFQEQYDVTKKMSVVLKSYPQYWNAYLNLLRKINDLIKNNLLYQNYSKIYPSPEMQRRWLLPVED